MGGALPALINSGGYGLTFGVHSRVEATVDRFCREVEAGNIYVNRNIIGAMVGVQPFGGRGLSGTGPKAGGPYYLERLVQRAKRGDAQSMPVLLAHGTSLLSAAPDACSGGWGATITTLAGASATWREIPMAQCVACAARLRDQTGLAERADQPSRPWPSTIDSLMQQAHSCLLPIEFAGPTGESNTLRLEARGVIVCLADGGDSVLASRVLAEREGAILPLIDDALGPAYLSRFCYEKTISINTTAAGGNAALMAGGEPD